MPVLPVFFPAAYSQDYSMQAQHFRNNTYCGLKVTLCPALQRFHSTLTHSSCFQAKVNLISMRPARNELITTSSGLSGYFSFVVSPPFRIRRCSRRPCKCCRTARPKLTSFACRSAKLCRPLSTTTTRRVSVTQPLNAKCAHCSAMLLPCAEEDLDRWCFTGTIFGHGGKIV